MKRTLLVLAVGSLSLMACSKSSDSKSLPPPPDADTMVIDGLSAETPVSGTELNSYAQISSSCKAQKYDTRLLGRRSKIELKVFDEKSFEMTGTSFYRRVNEKEIIADVKFDLYRTSIFEGPAFEGNQAINTCKIENEKSSCKMTGEYTKAAKDYLAAHPEAKAGSVDKDDNCETHMSADDKRAKDKFSKASYVMENGRRVNVMVRRTTAIGKKVCAGKEVGEVAYAVTSVYSQEVMSAPDLNSFGCSGAAVVAMKYDVSDVDGKRTGASVRALIAPIK